MISFRSVLTLGSILGMFVTSAWAASTATPEEAAAYDRGAATVGSHWGGFHNDVLAALRLVRSGAALNKQLCSAAEFDLASSIDSAWKSSKLGRAEFTVNAHRLPSEVLYRAVGGRQLPAHSFKGLPECHFFGAFLAGIEEALPEQAQVLLDIPPNYSPYILSSKNPVLRIKIGQVGPSSGTIAHLGKENHNAAQMAIDDLNAKGLQIGGKPVRFIHAWADDAANPENAVPIADWFISYGVKAVVGHLNSGLSIPASREYSRAGIPMISPASTNPWLTRQGFKSVFRMVMDDEKLGMALAVHAKNVLRSQRVIIIQDGTAYGGGLAWAFDVEATRLGIEVVSREATTDQTKEFSSILPRVKSASPDLVFFGGMDAVAGPLLKQMRDMGISAKLMGGDGICSPELVSASGSTTGDDQVFCAEAGVIGAGLDRTLDEFRVRYKAKFGVDVEIYAPYVYDAVMLVGDAMVRAQSSEPTEYLPYLRRTDNYQGVTGVYKFDDRGDPVSGRYTLYTYRNGERVIIGTGP